MGVILDLSKFQDPNKTVFDYDKISKQVSLVIARVQYGSTKPDELYQTHVSNFKLRGVPINTYTFPHFVSVNDARVEARDCWSRTDKDSKVIWVDIEAEYDSNKNPVGITKLSQSVRLDGIKAYVDELRKQGAKKIGAYIANNIYESWGINTIINIFDTVWIPKYGKNDGTVQNSSKPSYPCDLWQYTSVGKLDGYNGSLDLSILNGDKPLEWFTEVIPAPPASICYQSHIQDIGWQGCVRDGATAGTTGQSLRLEALIVRLENTDAKLTIEGHVQNYGWTAPRTNGEVIGTVGEGLRLEAVKIKCDKLDVSYRVHLQDTGWMDWVRNGDVAGTVGQAKRIEAIEIKLG